MRATEKLLDLPAALWEPDDVVKAPTILEVPPFEIRIDRERDTAATRIIADVCAGRVFTPRTIHVNSSSCCNCSSDFFKLIPDEGIVFSREFGGSVHDASRNPGCFRFWFERRLQATPSENSFVLSVLWV